jgi:peptidase M50B-like protein
MMPIVVIGPATGNGRRLFRATFARFSRVTADLPTDLSGWDEPRVLVVATFLAAVVLTGWPAAWRVLRFVVTIAHEGGHAVAALLVGRQLAGIRLHSDTSGVTLSRGKPRGPGMILTASAGYPAPSLLGVVFAVLIALERVSTLLWLSVVLLVLLLVQLRNVVGVLGVLVVGALAGAVIFYGTPRQALIFACGLTWLLLVGGLRAVIELQRTRRRQMIGRPGPHGLQSDADQLARLSHLPGLVWVTAFFGVALAAVLGSGWLMLADPTLPSFAPIGLGQP